MESNDYVSCPFCGGAMYWSQTESASEIIDEYADDNEALVNYYKCSVCGCDYEIVDPPLGERETLYKNYWNGQ